MHATEPIGQQPDARPQPYLYKTFGAGHAHSYLLPALIEALGRPSGPVLDLGCGNGWIAHELAKQGFDVYGVDISASGISLANRQSPGRFHVIDLGRGALPDALLGIDFKTVISTEVIEHLYDPRSFLRLARSILVASRGRLIVSTPYHGYLKNLALAVAGKMDQHFTVHWGGGHIKFFSRRTLEKLLVDEGFRPGTFAGVGRLPLLWKSMVVTAEVQ